MIHSSKNFTPRRKGNNPQSIVGLSNSMDGFSSKDIIVSGVKHRLDSFLAHSLREILNDC
jgi:hypothetical protein